jgi:hypothetical protein
VIDGDASPVDCLAHPAAGEGPLVGWIAAAAYFAFLGSFAVAWFVPPSLVGIGDWDWVFSDAWLSVNGLLERGWPALWSIQLAGGAPLAADPESLSHSPFLLLPLMFGPIVGTKLLVTVLIATGLVGCHRLGLRWIGDHVGAAAFAFAFVFSGHFAIHFRAGHLPWAAFYLVPWVLFYADRLLFDPTPTRAASFGFLAVLLALFSGLVYHPLVYFLFPAAIVYALTDGRRAPWTRLRYLASLGVCAMTLTTIRWLAVIDWEESSPRNVVGVGGMPLGAMAKMLVAPIADYKSPVTWGGSGIWEYWSYVGVVASLLAATSLVSRGRWRTFALPCLLAGVVLAWRGPSGSPLEWVALQTPFLSSVRVYTRFLVLPVFAIALLAGGAIGALRRRMPGRLAWLPLLLLAAIVADYWVVVRPIWCKVFALPVAEAYPDWGITIPGPRYGTTLSAPHFQELRPDREMFNSRMLPLIMAGAVVRNAYITLALPWGRPPEGRVVERLPEGAYRLRNHEIDLSGDFRRGEQIDVHLHYKKAYWRVADRESALVEPDPTGMKIVILEPCHHVRVVFRDGREIIGWIISGIAVASTFAVFRRGA